MPRQPVHPVRPPPLLVCDRSWSTSGPPMVEQAGEKSTSGQTNGQQWPTTNQYLSITLWSQWAGVGQRCSGHAALALEHHCRATLNCFDSLAVVHHWLVCPDSGVSATSARTLKHVPCHWSVHFISWSRQCLVPDCEAIVHGSAVSSALGPQSEWSAPAVSECVDFFLPRTQNVECNRLLESIVQHRVPVRH